MPRATCRCGQALDVPTDGTDRVVCPQCGAKVRLRRPPAVAASESTEEGGFLRFNCSCGRRLKVVATPSDKPSHVKCPDCGRVVPVPSTGSSRDPETPTEELSAVDAATIEAWSKRHRANATGNPSSTQVLAAGTAPYKSEAGLRLCPGCGKPVHLGAIVCRECGSHVPKR